MSVVFPSEPELLPQDKMDKLTQLAERAGQLEADLLKLEEETSAKSKELNTILGGYQEKGLLIELMESCGSGVQDITLGNGTRIVVNEDLKAPSMGASSKYREVVIDWLKKTGQEGVIKNELTVNVPKGKEQLATAVEQAAIGQGLQVKRFETVNAQTLAALLRELLESGADVPLDQIGAFMVKRAEVLLAKEKS